MFACPQDSGRTIDETPPMLRIWPWSYEDLPKLRTLTKAQWLLDGQYKLNFPTSANRKRTIVEAST